MAGGRQKSRRRRSPLTALRTGAAAASLLLAAARSLPAQGGAIVGAVRGVNVRVAGAVVYLVGANGAAALSGRDSAVIDQVNLTFVPGVLVVLPGTTVEFLNSDPFLHNVFSPGGAGVGGGFDLGRYPKTESRSHRFTQLGPHIVLCHVHPEMAAFVFVAPTPYHAVVGPEGRFRIDGVPPGRYALRTWHFRARSVEQRVNVVAGADLGIALELVKGRDPTRVPDSGSMVPGAAP